ncbi:DNA-binding transcriptional regulator, LysR family [Poseidonocella pacifica]|uniref:DNA-binding transcriptional regulator, LysR family n=1 Tax=Poseidonocella pacifica TaxID=871651 RepID=A0A1I0X9M2_9RHOB|nr:LysR family transcriptional regulator [Poseidonocella pacifica]SFA97584.1 DNA-binding transcriptional regulator, LysR family [Poseidonocella pacifica]
MDDLLRRLKPSHLALLERIAETGKLQTAAALSGMSQPAASRILHDMEAGLDVALFERGPKGMVPTAAGTVVARHAGLIRQGYEGLGDEIAALRAGRTGSVRAGAVTGPAVALLVPAIQTVRQSAPQLDVSIDVAPSAELLRGLEERRFDFVIARLPPEQDSAPYHLRPARPEIISLLVRRAHPLAGLGPQPLSRLADHDWIMQERGSPVRQAVEAAFLAGATAAPGRVTNSSSLLVMLAMLQTSDAIAPVTDEVAQLLRGPGHATLPFEPAIHVSPCYLITLRSAPASSAAQRVIAEVTRRLGA